MKKDNKQEEKVIQERPEAWLMLFNVKAVILNKNNEVLILKRVKEEDFNGGKFDLVGGYVSQNETFEEGLLREIQEETGLKELEIISVIKASEFEKEHPKFNKLKALRFLVRYTGEAVQPEIELSEEEHQSSEWLPMDEAIKKFSDSDGFEKEKKETLLAAMNYLERENSLVNLQRTLADFDNYKKRALEREREFNKYAAEGIVSEMLPVVDNFYAATEHIPENDQESPWVTGIMYIQKQMEKVFEDNNVKEIPVKIGDKFDITIMEAMKNDEIDEESKPEQKKNKTEKVIKIVQRGYKIGDKIMRPVKVIVG
jgi:molecular chaperone GrpE